jgi:3D (Asp-Asp-Asp) domain-containing protein
VSQVCFLNTLPIAGVSRNKSKEEQEDILKKMGFIAVFAFLVFSATAVTSSLNWKYVNKQRNEKEVYLFATGYYQPEKDQNFYVTGSYQEDLELNGQGITASGKEVKRGYVAVDPSVIPLGTIFHSEEYGILKAEDRGGRIKGNRIDIFAGNGEHGLIKALKIRGWLKLRILKWGAQEVSS